jgi:hypothetical protein
MNEGSTAETFASALTHAIAIRLADVVPQGFAISDNAGLFTIKVVGSVWFVQSDISSLLPEPDEKSIRIAANAMVDVTQDFATRELRTPWPDESNNLALPGLLLKAGN